MPRKKSPSKNPTRTPRSSRQATASPPTTDPSLLRRIVWLIGLATWLFVVVALAGFDVADWPSTAVASHHTPSSNPAGIVGSLIAWWSYLTFGSGIWVIVILSAIALISIVRGHSISHPVVRTVGGLIAAVCLGALHHAWVLPFTPNMGSVPGLEAGLVPTEWSGILGERFGSVGASLILMTGFLLGLLVAADELVLKIPGAMMRSLESARGLDFEPLRRAVTIPFGVLGQAIRRLTDRRPALQPAGVPAHMIEDWVEEEDEDEDEDEDEAAWYGDGEEEEEEEEEEEPTTPHRASAAELQAKLARLPVRMATAPAEVGRDEDIPREENFEGYQFPTLDLLEDPEGDYSIAMEDAVREQAAILEEALRTFQIDAEVAGIESGPVVTLYAILLAPGTRVARLSAISSDIARALQAQNIRIIPNMAGKSTVGIEVPNSKKEKVRLKELMSSGRSREMTLPMFLGKDSAGDPLVVDLTKMPHMLIAGTTGSGKSVCMNTIIMSWLYTKRPDELKLCLVDPKMVEMSQFADIPHLMCPVITEMGKAAAILEWAVGKMEERYELLRQAGVRDIASYNDLGEEQLREIFDPSNDLEWAKLPKKLPYMVFVIDELADLMMTNKEVEHSIVRIAQKARAVGLHLILATQRPQANVVTGLIKSNMPCRVSFKVASGMDSRIVLDQKGAELLLGMGDMMIVTPEKTEVRRGQGTLVTDRETRQVAKFLKNVAGPTFERSLLNIRPPSSAGQGGTAEESGERDPLFDQAVEIMIETGRGSVSLLQRRMAIGYSRASRLVDQMGLAGILSDHKGSVAREVLISLEDWQRMKRLEDGLEASNNAEDLDGDFGEEDSGGVPAELPGEHRY